MIHPIFKPGPEWTPEEVAQAMELLLPDLIRSAEIVGETARQRLRGQRREDEPPSEPSADWRTYEAEDWALVYLENQFTRDLLGYRPLGHHPDEAHSTFNKILPELFRRMSSEPQVDDDEVGPEPIWHFRVFFRHAFHAFCDSVQTGERRGKEPLQEFGSIFWEKPGLPKDRLSFERASGAGERFGFPPKKTAEPMCSAALLAAAGGLFEAPRLRFRHPALRQAILDQADRREILAAHAELARGCLRCWRQEDSPARDYSVRWAVFHLEAAGLPKEARELLLTPAFLRASLRLPEGTDRLIEQVDAIAGDDPGLVELAAVLRQNRVDLAIQPARADGLEL